MQAIRGVARGQGQHPRVFVAIGPPKSCQSISITMRDGGSLGRKFGCVALGAENPRYTIVCKIGLWRGKTGIATPETW